MYTVGKTMSYLPAICSLVQDECVERMVPDGIGPVAVILCVSSMKVVEVAALCRKFLTEFSDDVRVIEGFGERNIKHIVVSLLASIYTKCYNIFLTDTSLKWLRDFGMHSPQSAAAAESRN